VICSNAQIFERREVAGAIGDAERMLGQAGRLLVRMSGTEPKARVMAEGEDEKLVSRAVDDVVAAIEREAS
jgi:phosphoglucosamine mutase